MAPEFVKKLKKLIAKDEIEDAITLLQKGDQWIPESAKEEILLLSGQLRQLRQQEMRGIISHKNALLEINKIRNGLLQFVQIYSKTPEEQAQIAFQKKIKWLLPLGIYLLITTGLIWWLFQLQPNFRMEANLLVERVSFKYLEGPTDFTRGEIQSCFWQNYNSFILEGDRVWVDENDDLEWDIKTTLNTNLKIKADENISGVGIRFGPARLEKLFLQPNAILTLGQNENTKSSIQLSIQQSQDLKSDWTFRDSLYIQAEMAHIEGVQDLSTIYSPTTLRVFPKKDQAREMKIYAFAGTTNLELQFNQDFEIEGKSLLIGEPSFYQPLESIAVPTLLRGEIHIGELDKTPLKNIHISEGQALDIFSDHNFSLQKINFGEKGITIKFDGDVSRLETGRNHDVRNPTRIEWWWHSQKMLVVAIVIVLLGMAIFLLIGAWKGIFKN